MKITENMSKEDGESLIRDMEESQRINTEGDGTFTDSQGVEEEIND